MLRKRHSVTFLARSADELIAVIHAATNEMEHIEIWNALSLRHKITVPFAVPLFFDYEGFGDRSQKKINPPNKLGGLSVYIRIVCPV